MDFKSLCNLHCRMNVTLKGIEASISEIRASIYPKSQTISDMPTGGGKPVDRMAQYVENLEFFERKAEKVKREIARVQKQIYHYAEMAKATKEEMQIFEMKYTKGMTWEEIARFNDTYISKCYRTFEKLCMRCNEVIAEEIRRNK